MSNQKMLRSYAKELREKPSQAQVVLYHTLHKAGITRIRRRLIIGNYIIQLALPRRNLLIEIDSPKSLENPARLYQREAWLQKHGFVFLRLKKDDITNHLGDIMDTISSFAESEEVKQQFWQKVRKARRPKRPTKDASTGTFPPAEPHSYSIKEIRSKHPKAYLPWTNEDDKELTEKYKTGCDMNQLVKLFQRQPGAIHLRLRKLKLLHERRNRI